MENYKSFLTQNLKEMFVISAISAGDRNLRLKISNLNRHFSYLKILITHIWTVNKIPIYLHLKASSCSAIPLCMVKSVNSSMYSSTFSPHKI